MTCNLRHPTSLLHPVVQSCIQLLKIVLSYIGYNHKKHFPGILRNSKEWKRFTVDMVPKSAYNPFFDSRDHRENPRRLCFPTFDRLEPWLILSAKTWSGHSHVCFLFLRKMTLMTYYRSSRYFNSKEQNKVLEAMVPEHVASDHGWDVILPRPGRSGENEPGLHATGGLQHKRRALNTRLSSGTSAHTWSTW